MLASFYFGKLTNFSLWYEGERTKYRLQRQKEERTCYVCHCKISHIGICIGNYAFGRLTEALRPRNELYKRCC